MRTWRLVANLVAFAAIALALVAYGVVDLLGNPLEPATRIAAFFPNASGLYPNFPVELDGVPVGSVSAVRLSGHRAEVDMTIDPGVRVPRDVVASVAIANDLGEQVVELTPRHGGREPALGSGAVVPVARGDVPVQIGKVVAQATRLLRDIPAGRLNQLLTELAQGLRGQSGNLRTVISASTTFSREFLATQHQFVALLKNAPPVMDAVSAAGPQLSQSLANTAALVQVLAKDRSAVQGDLANGGAAAGVLGTLVTNQAPDLACLIHDFSQLNANLDEPANLSNLSGLLALNRDFFGAVTAVAVSGVAKPLVADASANPDQTTLRTRMWLPPLSPPGDTYSTPVPVPTVKPGAGCSTELGQGVGAATQPGFVPAAGGRLSAPNGRDATVRGGGDPSSAPRGASGASAAFDQRRGSAVPVLLIVGGVLLPAFSIAWGVRPGRRRQRRRA